MQTLAITSEIEPLSGACPCSPSGDGGSSVTPLLILALVLAVWKGFGLLKHKQKKVDYMKKYWKLTVIVVLVLIVAVILAAKNKSSQTADNNSIQIVANSDLPKLVEFGSVSCVPCKMMAPILEELKQEYTGIFEVDFVDVQQNRSAISAYSIDIIPTQVFFDVEGKELYRHQGFFPKQELLNKWQELGIKVEKTHED